MSIRIDGELIESTFEIWSVKRKSTDGSVSEVAFDDEEGARLDHAFYGGQLWVRKGFASVGHEVETGPVEELVA